MLSLLRMCDWCVNGDCPNWLEHIYVKRYQAPPQNDQQPKQQNYYQQQQSQPRPGRGMFNAVYEGHFINKVYLFVLYDYCVCDILCTFFLRFIWSWSWTW